jgi:hypothetical protein
MDIGRTDRQEATAGARANGTGEALPGTAAAGTTHGTAATGSPEQGDFSAQRADVTAGIERGETKLADSAELSHARPRRRPRLAEPDEKAEDRDIPPAPDTTAGQGQRAAEPGTARLGAANQDAPVGAPRLSVTKFEETVERYRPQLRKLTSRERRQSEEFYRVLRDIE